jgi:hypothetical protein
MISDDDDDLPEDGRLQGLNHMFNIFSCLHFVQLSCRFLYTLFLAIDANYKFKGKDHSIDDPELAPGRHHLLKKSITRIYIKI